MQQRWLGLSDPAFRLQSLLWSCSADIPRVVCGHWHFSYVRKQSCEKGFIWSRVHNLSSANNLESVQDQLLALCKKTEVFLSRNWLFYSGCMSLKIVLIHCRTPSGHYYLRWHAINQVSVASNWNTTSLHATLLPCGGPAGPRGDPLGPNECGSFQTLVWVWTLVQAVLMLS